MTNIKYSAYTTIKQIQKHNTNIYKFSGCPYKKEISIRDRNGDIIKVDCKKCLYCLIKKQSILEFYAKKELFEQYKAGKGASFITLTYSDDYEPIAIEKEIVKNEKYYPLWNLKRKNGEKTINEKYVMVRPKEIKNTETLKRVINEGINTLYKKDFKNFMKNFRRQMEYHKYKGNFKYIYCGEYGDKLQRSHMHLIIMGLTQEESTIFTRKCWKYGLIDIGTLGNGGIRYLIDYVSKSQQTKEMKEKLDEKGVEPPFIYHSIKMGLDYIIKHATELYNNKFYYYNGKTAKKTLIPISAIKTICNILNLNYYKEIEKIMNEKEKEIEYQAKIAKKEIGEYQYEKRIETEKRMYNNIRIDGKKSISPRYLTDIEKESKYNRPKSKKIKPANQLKYYNIVKEIKKLETKNNEEVKNWYEDYIDTLETINLVKCSNFFENIA